METEPVSAPKRRGADRRAEILRAARAIFIERGYAGTSTDAILERSGGSKETIYSHFGSKLGLFRAVVLAEAGRLFESPGGFNRAGPAAMLRAVGRSFARSFDAETLQLARMVIAERDRIRDIAAEMQETGTERFAREIAAALTLHQERGTLGPADTLLLGRAFVDLLAGQTVMRPLFDPSFQPTTADLDRHVDLCVDVILRLADPKVGLPPFGAAPLGAA